MPASTDDYKLRYSRNGGAYTDVTSSSTHVQSYASSPLTNQASTTNKLTLVGGVTFTAGRVSTDGQADDTQIDAGKGSEFLYSLKIIDDVLNNGDTLDFRVECNGSVLATYSVTPRITISKSAKARGSINEERMRIISGKTSAQRKGTSTRAAATARPAAVVSVTILNGLRSVVGKSSPYRKGSSTRIHPQVTQAPPVSIPAGRFSYVRITTRRR